MYTTLTDHGRSRPDSLTKTRTPVYPDPGGYLRAIPPIMNSERHHQDQIADMIIRTDGVMTRVKMVNTTLRHLRVECSELESLARAGTLQLAAVQEMARVGDRAGTRTALLQFQGTVTSLSDMYRIILVQKDLPDETAQGVLSVAQSLDMTAVRAGLA